MQTELVFTRKGVTFAWTTDHQVAFDTLKACLLQAPILGFPTEEGRFVLDTDASLFAVGGVLNQLQDDREVVIVYASQSLRLSQRWYCTTRWDMLAAVSMCTHFRLYLRAHSSLCALITILSDGSRNFGTVMGCWPDGICCLTHLHLSIPSSGTTSGPVPPECFLVVPLAKESPLSRLIRLGRVYHRLFAALVFSGGGAGVYICHPAQGHGHYRAGGYTYCFTHLCVVSRR